MREDNGTRIIIARPKPDTYILPAISIPSNHNLHPSQTELHRVKSRKQKIQQMKLLSLDQICLRDCCQRKQEIYKQSVAQALQKKNYLIGNNKHDRYTHIDLKYPLSTKNERFRKHKKRMLTYEGEKRSKNKIYFLHNLKQFELQDIEQQRYGNMNESQAKHKTGHTNKSRLIEWKDNFSKDHIHLKNYNEKPKQKQKIQKDKNADNNRKINESYIYSDLKTSRTNQRQPIKHSIQKDQAKTNQTKKYYKYLENYQSQEEQERTSPHRKVMNSEQDQQKSVQSYFKPQTRKEVNTIFHSNKLKLSSSSLKQSRIKSSRVISKAQAFKIPHTQEQQTQYLLNYKPLDPHFDVKSIVSKQNFNILLKDEKIYFGLFRDEKKNGLGILISQKQWFEGEFSYDLKVQGIQKTSQGIYVGTYAQGLRDGQGKYTWANGQEFEGEWKKGKKNGHGIWKSPKGDFYEGEWKNNKQNGKGLFTHIGGSKYSGYFKDFLKHGRGEEEFANGDKYIGQYKYGKPHGYGKYIWANGDTYEGEFAQGSREGQGTMTKKNAESYQGCFVNDLKQGQGKQRFISGEYFQGFFQKDEKIRGKFYSKKGILLQELN